jgi:hypothetical protein
LNQTSFRFAGVAAMLVFAIGLFAIGKFWIGLGVLVFGLLAAAIATTASLSARALFGGVGGVIVGVVLGYQAASNEINGIATYHHRFGRHSLRESVTRQSSPVKFREATNSLWAGSVFCITGAAAAFYLARKLDDSDF